MKRVRWGRRATRRQFMKNAAAAVGGIVAAPTIVPGTVLGAEGVIGLGGRGQYVMGAFMEQPDAQVLAVCDVIADRREGGRKQVNAKYGNEDCATYIDFLELLDRRDIDAVLIATGDNWHSGASLMAARALSILPAAASMRAATASV